MNIWKRLEELIVPLELRVFLTRLYDNVIANINTIDGWLEEINWNLRFKKKCPLSPTIFCIYNVKVE